MQVTFAFLLLNDSVDNVLGASKEDLPLKKHLDVLVLAHHLEQVDWHVLLLLWEVVQGSVHLAQIAHIDTSLVEQIFQWLRVDRHILLLFQVLDKIWDSFFCNESAKILDILLLSLKFGSSHV